MTLSAKATRGTDVPIHSRPKDENVHNLCQECVAPSKNSGRGKAVEQSRWGFWEQACPTSWGWSGWLGGWGEPN